MINLDALSIKAFLFENKSFLLGAKIQKIQQPNRKELIFHLRNNSESKKLYVNINPSFFHICFMNKENEDKRNIKIPKAAAMFCMLLRKYFDGAKIIGIEQPKNERIIELYFDYYDILNEESKLCLSIELMGKHSNVVLYNYDTNVIIGCAHNVGSEKSRDRELAGLLPYIYPPRQKKIDLLDLSFEEFASIMGVDNSLYISRLANEFYMVTNNIAAHLYENVYLSSKSLKLLYDSAVTLISLIKYKPSIKCDYSEFSLFHAKGFADCHTVNEMLDDYFAFQQNKTLCLNMKNKLLSIVNQQIKKLSQLKNKQEYQLNQVDKAQLYKLKGDLLMANLYVLKPNLKQVNLQDFVSGGDILIDLDPLFSPIENANRYYKLYKKMKSAQEYAQTLLTDTDNQLNYFNEQKFFIETCSELRDLEDIEAEIKGDVNLNNISKKQQNEPNLLNINIRGYRVFVGKNSKQNDYILSKIASPDDIWFHPLNIAGSHVVLKKNNSKEQISDDVLYEAAKLTKEHSSVKNNSKVPIIYTQRKYVKKAKSKGLAFVTYKNATEILLD